MKKNILAFSAAVIILVLAAVFTVPFFRSIANKELPYFGNDPDMPGFLDKAKKDFGAKQEFLIKRNEAIALKRGISKDKPFDPMKRQDAIRKMERQEAEIRNRSKNLENSNLLAAWTPLGPAPIPNGQTTTNSVPVSGRTTAIAIHPTNPDIVYVGTAQGGLYRTTDGGTNWTPLMDGALSLAIGAVAIAPSQPETIYVGTGEGNFSADSFFGVGIYRIDNASTTANLTGPFGPFIGRAVSEIVVHPTVPATIFASSTSGVGGIRPTGPSAPSEANLFRSTDATSATPSFTQFFAGSINFRDLAIDPSDPNILLANAVGTGIIRITDALGAFTFTIPLPFADAAEIASQKSGAATDATFFVVTGEGSGRVYRSTDGGVGWSTQITNGFCGGQCFYNLAVAVDPTDPDNVYIGGQAATAGLITGRSINGATSFTTVNFELHADTHSIEVAPSNPAIVWTGNDGGIFKSTNSGATYISMNNSQFSATQFMSLDVHPTDANFSLGGTQDNGTNWYQPGGTWTRADFGDGGFAQIDQNAPDTTNVRMYHTYFNVTGLQGYGTVSDTASASDGLWSFRGCQSGGATVNGITCNGVVNFYAPLERGPGNPNSIYYGSDRLYRSSDTGLNHSVVSQNPIASGVPISAIGVSQQNDNVRMVGLNDGGLFGTSTGSTTLTDLDPGSAVPNSAIARTIIDPTNQTTAYVTLSAFGVSSVWKTTNLNNLIDNIAPTWTDASGTGPNTIPQIPVNSFAVDPSMPAHLYAGTDIGVYHSPDGGVNWMPFGTGLPRVAVFGLSITNAFPRQVRIATHGRGLFQTPAAFAPTAASVRVAGRVLSSTGLAVSRAFVTITNSGGQSVQARTNNFGYYSFEGISAGETYTITVIHKQYQFNAQLIDINEDLHDLNLIALP